MFKPGLPAILMGGDWLATKPPEPDWLIEPLFVHPNKVIFAGESTAGKSWVLADMALHLGAGHDWLGFRVPQARAVLYVNEDMGDDDLQARFWQLGQGNGIDARPLPVKVMNNQGVSITVDSGAKQCLALLHSVKLAGFDPDVVIFETMLKIAPGDINSNDAMASLYNNLSVLVHDPEHKRTVIVSHHLTKFAGDDPAHPIPITKRVLGAGYVIGGADAAFAISRTGPDHMTLEFLKLRRGPEHPPVQIRRHCAGVNEPAHHERVERRRPAPIPSTPAGGLFAMPTP